MASGRGHPLGQPPWDQGFHGFNFMAQLYGCTPANGVWVVPGAHRLGKVDIEAMVAEAGTERLPDAAPMVCAPGDVAICNRQVLHGSFANTSARWRVTVNFGFHRCASVLGVRGGGLHDAPAVYDEERVRRRSSMIGYAIDARRQRFPDETRFVYEPFAGPGGICRWSPEVEAGLKDYNLLDLGIRPPRRSALVAARTPGVPGTAPRHHLCAPRLEPAPPRPPGPPGQGGERIRERLGRRPVNGVAWESAP